MAPRDHLHVDPGSVQQKDQLHVGFMSAYFIHILLACEVMDARENEARDKVTRKGRASFSWPRLAATAEFL